MLRPSAAAGNGQKKAAGKSPVYARNMLASWIGYISNIAVMFFLSPFVIHSLGKSAYGVWSLLQGITGYLGLAEIGVRVSTGRYINYYLGRQEDQKVQEVVNTSLVMHTLISILIIGLAGLVGKFFLVLFGKVPPRLAQEAQWVLLLLGLNLWLGLFSSTFRQLLHAADRFDLDNLATIIVLGLRTAGTVVVLIRGGGLIGLASISVITTALGCVILLAMVSWRGVGTRYGLRFVRPRMAWELFRFGLWAAIGNLSVRIIFYTDSAVIALLLGVESIAVYSIAFILIEAAKELVSHIARVIAPDMLKSGGNGNIADLRWLVLKTTRFVTLLGVPLFVGLLILGGEFINLWVGPEYKSAGMITAVLGIGMLFSLGAAPCANAMISLGDIKTRTLMTGVEAAINLSLSLVLVMVAGLGLVGVALGTMIPLIIVTGVWQPVYLCRRVGLPLKQYVRWGVLPWVSAAMVFAAMCIAALMLFPAHNWSAFVVKVFVLTLLYVPIGLFMVVGQDERRQIYQVVRTRKMSAAGILASAQQPQVSVKVAASPEDD